MKLVIQNLDTEIKKKKNHLFLKMLVVEDVEDDVLFERLKSRQN